MNSDTPENIPRDKPPIPAPPRVANAGNPTPTNGSCDCVQPATGCNAPCRKAKFACAVTQVTDCVKNNPLAMMLSAAAIVIAIGCAVALTRRHPRTLQERFADDPIQTTRDTLYAVLAPMANRVHDGYDRASRTIHGLPHPGRTLSDQLGRVGCNLKFW